MIGKRHEGRRPHPRPEIQQIAVAVANRGAEQNGIEARAESLGRLREGQSAAQKGVMCDFRTFYNLSAVG